MFNKKIKFFIFKIFIVLNFGLLINSGYAENQIVTRTIELKSDNHEEAYQSLQNELKFLTKKVEKLEQELYHLKNDFLSKNNEVETNKIVTSTIDDGIKNDDYLEEDIFSVPAKVVKENNNKKQDKIASTHSNLNKIENKELKTENKEPESKKLYNTALVALKEKKYEEAEKKFGEFIKKYSNNPLAGNAYYWYAESYAKLDNYDKAAINYLKGYKNYPRGEKAADSLLKLSFSLEKLGKQAEAKQVLLKLKEEFPKRTASQIKATEDALMRINAQ